MSNKDDELNDLDRIDSVDNDDLDDLDDESESALQEDVEYVQAIDPSESDDEDEGDDDEEYLASEPLLSTSSGKMLVAAGAMGAVLIGFSGYSFLSRTNAISVAPPSPSTQNKGDWGQSSNPAVPEQVDAGGLGTQAEPLNSPSYDAAIDAQLKQSESDLRSLLTQKSKVDIEGEQVSAKDETRPVQEPAISPIVPAVPLPELERQPVSQPTSAGAVIAGTSAISKNDIEQVVSEVISKHISSLDSTVNSELEEKVTNLNDNINLVTALLEEQKELNKKDSTELLALKKKEADRAREISKKQEIKRAHEARLYDEAEKIKAGKHRLKGFVVTNSSEDGTMSIVKAPSGNINVFFEGEKLLVSGKGRMKVTQIANRGRLVVINDKWFIDETYEAEPKPQSKSQPEKPKKKEPVATKKKEQVKEYRVTGNGHGEAARAPSGVIKIDRPVAKGWTMNAVFKDGYLIKDPGGNWHTVRNGQSISGLGVVMGIGEGSLVVGEYIINEE